MNELMKLLSEYSISTLLITIILLCLSLKGIIEFIGWVKKTLESYRTEKNLKEDEVADMKEQISSLDNRITRLEEMQTTQRLQLEGVSRKLDDMVETNRKQTIASFRSTLYGMYVYMNKREETQISQIEYETFKDMADQYIALGGNHTMKDLIIPKIEAKYKEQVEGVISSEKSRDGQTAQEVG